MRNSPDTRAAGHVARASRAVCVLGAAIFCSWAAGDASAVTPGETAPRCDLAALGAGPVLDTALAASGRVVLVDFWASWCAPCAHAFGSLNELERDFREAGFSVIGVNVDEDPDDALDFLERHPAEFALGADPTGVCPRAFAVIGMPSSYLVDRRGVVRSVHRGFRPSTLPALRAEIESLLAESPSSDERATAR